jgi:hypothetical protein
VAWRGRVPRRDDAGAHAPGDELAWLGHGLAPPFARRVPPWSRVSALPESPESAPLLPFSAICATSFSFSSSSAAGLLSLWRNLPCRRTAVAMLLWTYSIAAVLVFLLPCAATAMHAGCAPVLDAILASYSSISYMLPWPCLMLVILAEFLFCASVLVAILARVQVCSCMILWLNCSVQFLQICKCQSHGGLFWCSELGLCSIEHYCELTVLFNYALMCALLVHLDPVAHHAFDVLWIQS